MKIKADNEFDQHRIDKALAQNGESVIIHYKELKVLAPKADIEYAINYLTNCADRTDVMRSVMKVLQKNYKSVLRGKASHKTAMEYGQDLAIWYANELIAREALE